MNKHLREIIVGLKRNIFCDLFDQRYLQWIITEKHNLMAYLSVGSQHNVTLGTII